MPRLSNPLAADPTRTLTLRTGFAGAFKRRLRALVRAVYTLVVEEDAFGDIPPEGFTLNAARKRWAFLTTAAKLSEFQKWLQDQLDRGLLLSVDMEGQSDWMGEYIQTAYKRGFSRVYADVNPESLSDSLAFYAGGKNRFLNDAFRGPKAKKQMELLGSRAFETLKGVTADMSSKISVALLEGFVFGKHPFDIAKAIADTVQGVPLTRATTLARTEIIRAYGEGQLDAFDRLGIEEVTVYAEWATAGDGRVCSLCAPLDGLVLTVDEARGLLPRHPNCRCCWLPAGVGEVTKRKQKTQKEEIAKAVDDSIEAESPSQPLQKAKTDTRWAGADRVFGSKVLSR